MVTAKDIFIKKIFEKTDVKNKTALDRMNGIMTFINFLASVTGTQFTHNWKRNANISIAVFVDFGLMFCNTYTVYTHFPSVENIILIGGIAEDLAIGSKLFLICANHDKFMSLLRFIFNVLKCNPLGARQDILINMTNDIYFHLTINFSGFLFGTALFAGPALYDPVFNNKLTGVSPMELPLIDPTQITGYWITSGVSIIAVYFLITVSVATSSLYFVFVDAYSGLISLMELDVETFDAMCQKKNDNNMCDPTFRGIMVEVMDLARFSSHLKDLYTAISTFQVAMAYLVVVTTLHGLFAHDYRSGIGAGLCLYAEILMYCYIGQLLENSNQRIATVICNAKWYTYKLKHQKNMLTALCLAQNMQPIWLANLCPLNFQTGLQITKSIYSLLMFMLEMVN